MRYTIANLESSFVSNVMKLSATILVFITCLAATIFVTGAAQAQDVSATIANVQRFTSDFQPTRLLAAVTLEDVLIDGRRPERQRVTFTLTSTQRDVQLAIGIHEGDTVKRIDAQVTPVLLSVSGLKTFYISHLNQSALAGFTSTLTGSDQQIVFSICKFLTVRRNIDAIFQQLIRSTDHPAPSNYIATREFFPASTFNVMISELVFIANRCVDEITSPILSRTLNAPSTVTPATPNPAVDPLPERISKLEEQLAAANQTNVELREELTRLRPFGDRAGAAEAEVERLERQVGALNATIADMGTGTVSIVEHQAVRAQLAAANQTIVELRDNVADLTPSVGKAETAEAEVAMLQQQNAALNATIADLRRSTVSVSEHQEVEAQLDAANQTIVELQSRVNSLAPFVEAYRTEQTKNAELIQQVEALNATITDLRNSTVSVRDHQEVQSQLAAVNQTVVELRDRISALENDIQNLQRTVASTNDQLTQARQLVMSLQQTVAARDQQIDALNATVTELRARMENDFVPLDRFNLSQAQLAALNATILELQERNDLQRTRMVEAEAMFRNLRNDCSETPECARAMQLD